MIQLRLSTGYCLYIPPEAAYLRKNEAVSEVPEAWKDARYPYPPSNTLPSDGPMLRQSYRRTSTMYEYSQSSTPAVLVLRRSGNTVEGNQMLSSGILPPFAAHPLWERLSRSHAHPRTLHLVRLAHLRLINLTNSLIANPGLPGISPPRFNAYRR